LFSRGTIRNKSADFRELATDLRASSFSSAWLRDCNVVRSRHEGELNDPPRIPREEITKSILSYFLKSPDLVESFDGIARWRLLEEQVHRSVTRTELALHWLIDEGFLLPDTTGSRTLYRLNPDKLMEAENLVRSRADLSEEGGSS